MSLELSIEEVVHIYEIESRLMGFELEVQEGFDLEEEENE